MWGTLPFPNSLGALGLVISGGEEEEEEEEAWLGYKRLLQWWMFEAGPKRLIISGESWRNDEYLRLGRNETFNYSGESWRNDEYLRLARNV